MDYDHTVLKHLENVSIGTFVNIFNRLYRRIDENTFERVLTSKFVKASSLHKQNRLQTINLVCGIVLYYSANDTITAHYGNDQYCVFPAERLSAFLEDLCSKNIAKLSLNSADNSYVVARTPVCSNDSMMFTAKLYIQDTLHTNESSKYLAAKRLLISNLKRFLK